MHCDQLANVQSFCDNGTVVMWKHPLRVLGRDEDPVSDIYSQTVLRAWVQSLVLPGKENATLSKSRSEVYEYMCH